MIKKFGDKTILIRPLSAKDLKRPEKFQEFINSLVEEDAMIYMNIKQTKQQESEWLKDKLKNIRKKKAVTLIAECDGMIVGNTGIALGNFRQSHVGEFGITIRWGYRGVGLGSFLMGRVIKLAEKELKPKPKMLELGVFAGNAPALRLYTKMGFREVARVPKALQYKGKLINRIIMTKKI